VAPRVAVVGHVELVEFCVVDRLPEAGQVAHAREWFTEPGGGGAVAAVQLRRLAGAVTFLTALGDDDVAASVRADLEERHGVAVRAAVRRRPHRRAFAHIDAAGERTQTILGDRIVPHGDDPLPWDELSTTDAVYLTAGDPAAVRAARAARVLVASARAAEALAGSGVEADVAVASAADERERPHVAGLSALARAVVVTEGAHGGAWTARDGTAGRWAAAALPGRAVDAYGCGDAFAAGLTFGLASGLEWAEALALGARCGAHCLAGRGAYAAQLQLDPASVRRSAS
jgi:ribokinase